jgi:histone-binding protein RBBP4
LSWSPHNPTIFASASSDRRINIWDLSQIGVEQTPDDQEDGPPELMFVHGGMYTIPDTMQPSLLFFTNAPILGHTARPTDFCWAPGEGENWTASSVSEDNVVMVWQPTQRVWAGDDVPIDDKELENDAMQGVESTHGARTTAGGKSATGTGTGSARSQSMSISASASASGVEADEEDV